MKFDNGYILIVDTDADRIAAAVRGCGDVLPVPAFVARDGDDAIRILQQCGPPVVMVTALALPGRDGLLVIESLRRLDANAAVIAWAADRDMREYAANQLAHSRAKVLSRPLSADVCRRCVEALTSGSDNVSETIAAPSAEKRERREEREGNDENWMDLAERTRQRLRVTGAAAYTKVRGETEYRWSVSWRPDTPMLNFPMILPSALEEVMGNGIARMWSDLSDDSSPSSVGAGHVAVRSLAIVPILREGEMAGALCVFDSEPDAVRDEGLETLSALAKRSPAREPGPALPVDRAEAGAMIKELALVGDDELEMSVIVFAITARRTSDLPAIGDIFASTVRGNDMVVRWTDAEVLVVLNGVEQAVAERVADRIRDAVQTKSANTIAVSGVVTDLRAADSFEDTVARTTKRLRKVAREGRPRIA
jgi:DNA-binding NarL/FixJ family response regulator